MGKSNQTPAHDRGWVFLERFVTMVKGAMVDETEFERVWFSNSPVITQQIKEGSAKLRTAARMGAEALRQELGTFFEMLDGKRFGGASVDKTCNTGGLWGATVNADRDIVAGIMHDIVQHLPDHWAAEAGIQRQRQLVLATNRDDVLACTQLLQARADPNHQDPRGVCCLHAAAKHCSLGVVQTLLAHRADCSLQDTAGCTPAHNLPLLANEKRSSSLSYWRHP